MATKQALVVGGTNGIGYAIACRIAKDPAAKVIISGRNKPEKMPHPNMEFRQLDASSMRGIKQYAEQYKSNPENKLDMLVMTQGILTTAGRTETAEGIDRKMALHYYGRQLLIRELDPALTKDAKVVIVLDSLRGGPSKLDWDDLDLKTNFTLANAANHCLSMNDAMIQFYAAQNEQRGNKRHFIHAYPGLVKTNIATSLPWYLKTATKAIAAVLAVSADTCAENLMRGTSEAVEDGEKTGRYWSYIDDKGNLLKDKAIWTDEQMKKVADHTWKIVDDAIAVTGKSP